MHGKTGIAITLYHLSRETGNPVFEDFAGELLDDVTRNLTTRTSSDFENGLAGIGWGIEHLIRKGFLDADPDDILEDVDEQLFRRFLETPPQKIGLLNGTLGYCFYFLSRIQGEKKNADGMIYRTNILAIRQIIIFLVLQVSENPILWREPQKLNSVVPPQLINENINRVPVFDLLWDLSMVVRFAAHAASLPLLYPEVQKLALLLLEGCSQDQGLVLRGNRLNLLLSLEKLKQTFRDNRDAGSGKILGLAGQLISNLNLINENTMEGTGTTDFSLQYGMGGKFLIVTKLHELTSDISLKRESDKLLSELLSSDFLANYRFDYTNPGNAGAEELGLLRGLAGLIMVSLRPLRLCEKKLQE